MCSRPGPACGFYNLSTVMDFHLNQRIFFLVYASIIQNIIFLALYPVIFFSPHHKILLITSLGILWEFYYYVGISAEYNSDLDTFNYPFCSDFSYNWTKAAYYAQHIHHLIANWTGPRYFCNARGRPWLWRTWKRSLPRRLMILEPTALT
jgi:hypothetical protein